MALRTASLDDLVIEDEASFARVELYARLKEALRRSDHRFLVPERGVRVSWDRVLFLNLTYWSGADVLSEHRIAADEVTHVAWHHAISRGLARQAAQPSAGATPSPGPAPAPAPEALFFSEAIASAFDLYLVGRLLGDAPESDFITTQVPLMAERADEAGLSRPAFAKLLEDVTRAPERAFEDMRALLFDAANTLLACPGPLEAEDTLSGFAGHRFEPLLHHFEVSNWILYARAYGARSAADHPEALVVRRADALLRQAPDALVWLADNWLDSDGVRGRSP
jgi:hypothetical protein